MKNAIKGLESCISSIEYSLGVCKDDIIRRQMEIETRQRDIEFLLKQKDEYETAISTLKQKDKELKSLF